LGTIWNSIQYAYTALALIPILPFAIVLFGYGAIIQDRKKALRMAMDVSTAFFILCVGGLIQLLFNTNFGLYGILLFMLLGGGLLGNAQYRKRGSVDVKRIFKMVWRLSFFAMSFLYVVFMLFIVGKLIIQPA
jgi:Protein of unknown function (DUF3397).